LFPRLDSIVSLRNILNEDRPFRKFPSRDDLEACLEQAYSLAGTNPSPHLEAAALFFAFSVDEERIGDGRYEMPILIALECLSSNGLRLSSERLEELEDLQIRVAENGNAAWTYVREWFAKASAPLKPKRL
jgi:hypothetical protein